MIYLHIFLSRFLVVQSLSIWILLSAPSLILGSFHVYSWDIPQIIVVISVIRLPLGKFISPKMLPSLTQPFYSQSPTQGEILNQPSIGNIISLDPSSVVEPLGSTKCTNKDPQPLLLVYQRRKKTTMIMHCSPHREMGLLWKSKWKIQSIRLQYRWKDCS